MTVPAVHSSFGGVANVSNPKFTSAVILFLSLTASLATAGDDASGPIHYSTDLSRSFTTYAMSEQDNEWSASLVERLKYSGLVVHFVRTSLSLQVDKKTVQGAVYQ